MLVTCPNPHPEAPARPSTLKCCEPRWHTPTPYPFAIFTFGLTIESIKEFRCTYCKQTFHPFRLGAMLHNSNKCGVCKQKMHLDWWSNWGIYKQDEEMMELDEDM
jgi:hypothetical protein